MLIHRPANRWVGEGWIVFAQFKTVRAGGLAGSERLQIEDATAHIRPAVPRQFNSRSRVIVILIQNFVVLLLFRREARLRDARVPFPGG